MDALYSWTMGLQRVQLPQTASALAEQALSSYLPVSSKACASHLVRIGSSTHSINVRVDQTWHTVHGLHTLSEKSVHGWVSQYPGWHGVHRLQTFSMVSSCVLLLRAHSLRFTK